ncbi:histidine triad nucleotide-binding protein [Hugonella massiliensis]|uniref:histidine triad nucleotide-binding protein n=1 Tax=Hugonella massiliensis TaxID=1720315 RepID=UPI00073E5981|nr:histidine triad nucleotide-binding protein [Hugonella massiliensis]MDD6730766.1 histidine triad nucleotide-binding protein [Eggerthellaceae bacterium]
MHDDNCIFCKLATHEIPTTIVYEDEHVLAFDDMEPLMPVHVLIIPKDHYADIADNVPEETLGHVFAAVKKVAEIKGIREDGFRCMINTGENASQSVKHFHVHVLGGGWMPRPNDQDWGPNATNVEWRTQHREEIQQEMARHAE